MNPNTPLIKYPYLSHTRRRRTIVGTISTVSYVLVLYAVQLAPLSHVAPAREVSMLIAALIGSHLLCEGDRWLRFLGATFIATGVIAIGIS